MGVARVKTGFLKHINQVINTWGGKKATHRQIVEEIDDMGNIIDISYTDTIIYGLISPIDLKGSNQPIGHAAPGDLTAFFKYSDNVRMPNQLTLTTTRHDNIIYEDIEYQVYNVQYAYDVNVSEVNHEPVFGNYHLKKITTN